MIGCSRGSVIIRLEGDQATQLDVELFRRHFTADCVLANGLGATETGHRAPASCSGRDTPLAEGDRADRLSRRGHGGRRCSTRAARPAAPDEVGEIAVRSEYLALGYWNRPDLTARAFESDADGRRRYRTGDLGRLRRDGCLEHLGRKDSRTKIRGITVSLAEVEAAFTWAALDPRGRGRRDAPMSHDERRLIAYYVAGARARAHGERDEAAPRGAAPAADDPLALRAHGGPAAEPEPEGGSGGIAGALPWPARALDQACAPPEDPTQAELVHIWQDLLEVEPVGIRDDFFDLGGDSLLAAAMMAAIEEATGVDASPSILLSGSTIEHVAASLAQPAKPDTAVVPVQAAGSKAPLYFLHGDYLGRGMYCRKIARALGPDQPVFALTPCGLDGEPAPPTIEEMAARHLQALRRHQAHGPYRLVGNCNGGLIALEMARRLAEEGETVEQVLVIRTSAQNVRFSTARRVVERCSRFLGLGVETQRDLIRRWRWFVQAWSAGTASQRIGLIAGKLVRLVRSGRGGGQASAAARRPAPPTGATLMRTFTDAASEYVPLPYQGKVVVFWPAAGAGARPGGPEVVAAGVTARRGRDDSRRSPHVHHGSWPGLRRDG